MGSYRKAIMTGFICRLCSEHKSVVIHVYSRRAKSMALLDKITMLPITIKKYDKLPKTICESCIDSLCRQFDLVQQIRKSVEVQMRHRMFHSNGRCPSECPLNRTSPGAIATMPADDTQINEEESSSIPQNDRSNSLNSEELQIEFSEGTSSSNINIVTNSNTDIIFRNS